jgi:hypothetical protein
MQGRDIAASFRGRYKDEATAVALLGARGGLQAVMTSQLGAPLPGPVFAMRGDVVMVETAGGRAVGVCEGARAVCAGDAGIVFVEVTQWLAGWRV